MRWVLTATPAMRRPPGSGLRAACSSTGRPQCRPLGGALDSPPAICPRRSPACPALPSLPERRHSSIRPGEPCCEARVAQAQKKNPGVDVEAGDQDWGDGMPERVTGDATVRKYR